jgi:hypothetical protein
MSSPGQDFKAIWRGQVGDAAVGHDHFWERLSRRQLFGRTMGVATMAAAGSSLSWPAVAGADRAAAPRPIPGGTTVDGLGKFHFYFPTFPNGAGSKDTIRGGNGDPSTITDFNGFLGVGEWAGGTGEDQNGRSLFWAADARFMDGEYIGLDGRRHEGAFAFL